jgi:ABC-type lipoprotein export system ATPase subunit
MFGLFKKLNDQGKTVVFVTHSKTLAEKATRRIEMLDGMIVEG